jgi:DNA-binding NarL/FixJ family response regulator
MSHRITLLVAYRHTLLREALTSVLAAEADFAIVGHAANGKEAIEMAETHHPDVILMDAHLPIVSGVEAASLLHRYCATSRVLLLVETADDDVILSMLRAGVSSCLLHDVEVPELLTAIRAVHEGGSYLSPAIAERVARNYVRYATDPSKAAKPLLSLREREVLQLVADGAGNKAIAGVLTVAVKTVEAHKAHIAKKLGLRGPTALIRYAVQTGILDLEMAHSSASLTPAA